MKLSNRDQLILAIALILVAAVAFVALAIYPRFTDLAQLDSDSKRADQQTAQAKALLARRQEAKAVAASTQAALLRLENQIPDAPELPSLIIDLQDMATDAGVDFDQLTPTKPPAAAGGYSRLPLDFTVMGQWADVIDYLRRVNELDRAVRVLNVAIVPKAATTTTETVSGAPDVTVTLKCEAYVAAPTGSARVSPGVPTP